MPAPHDLDPPAMTDEERRAKRRYQAAPIVQRVRDVLNYDPATGIFVWRVTLSNRSPAGTIAGSETKRGYRYITIDGQKHQAHRLAWLYVHGVWPSIDLDHIDRHPQNNRLANLRQVTNSANQQNKPLSQRSRVGLAGVSPNGRRWKASIQLSGRQRHLGTFDTPDEAHAVYLAAKRELHPFHAFEQMPGAPECGSVMPGHDPRSPLHCCCRRPHADSRHDAPVTEVRGSRFSVLLVSWHDPLVELT